MRPFRRARRRSAPLVLVLASLACSGGASGPASSAVPEVAPAELGTPALRLVVVTDLMGVLEPCGCTSRPLGGIDGLAAALAAARAEHGETIFLAAGDLFHGATHPSELPGSEVQDQWRAELVADLLADFDLAAGVPGPHDFDRGLAAFLSLRARARFPLLAAGLSLDAPPAAAPAATPEPEGGTVAGEGAPPAPPPPTSAEAPAPPPPGLGAPAVVEPPPPFAGHLLVTRGGRTVGLVGVSAASGPGVHGPSDLVAAAEAEARAAREAGATFVVVLSSADRRTARRIATSELVDLVLEGGRDEAEVRPPAASEGAPVIAAGRHGQGLVIIDLFDLPGGGAPRPRLRDVSTWTRTVERDRLLEQAAELRARIAQWESAGTTGVADLSEVRARLARLEDEVAAVVAPPPASGPRLSLRHVELPPDTARDADVRARMDDLARRVNLHNRSAFASHAPEPSRDGRPEFEGTTHCAMCHVDEALWWRTTAHGRAYRTLRDRHREYNLDCVGCHVTGYEEPGGSTVSYVGALQDVGCESCHGPGSVHVGNPTAETGNVRREVPEDVCRRCHTPEHSDTFAYDAYRAVMITPVHGGTP